MAIASTNSEIIYPERDGKPMGETTTHRDAMMDLIVGLRDWFADDPLAYVSGNEFLYFVEGDPRRNVSPDVWFVHGIDKTVVRPIYKTWQEDGKGPDLVVECTSKSTRREDQKVKLALYRDVLQVREYFLFDPLGEYLKPPFQGFRLIEGIYEPIEAEAGRLPSVVLGLHLEAEGERIRLFNPAAGRRLLTRLEAIEREKEQRRAAQAEVRRKNAQLRERNTAIQQKDAAIQQKDAAIQQKDAIIRDNATALREAELEMDRLRRELEALRGGQPPPGGDPKPKPRPKRK